ncbi:MAG: winged helix-turn-helix transcriptional regulator [Nitrospirae bacterium]|nr:winged helix-turn-helix transcriptional regulator [Nitrospirota bacterium]
MNDEMSLRLLDEIAREPQISQRTMASRLGIAVGLVNAYVKRLYQKGCIKLKSLPRNRVKYIITPEGFVEKARLTYKYMYRSISYFKEIRQKIEYTYSLMIATNIKNILLLGDGEIAELCYISTRGLSIKIVGVIGEKRIENGFFDCHVYSKDDLHTITNYDAILVASLEVNTIKNMGQLGINPEMVYFL